MQTLNRIYDAYKTGKRFRKLWAEFVQLADTLPPKSEVGAHGPHGHQAAIDHDVMHSALVSPAGVEAWPTRDVAISRARALLACLPPPGGTAGGAGGGSAGVPGGAVGGDGSHVALFSPEDLSADATAFVALSLRVLVELAREPTAPAFSQHDTFPKLLRLVLHCCNDERFASKLHLSDASCEAAVVLAVDLLAAPLPSPSASASAALAMQLLVFVSVASDCGKKYLMGYRARLLRSIHVFLQRIAEEGKSVEPQRPFDEGSSPGASLQSTPELPHEDEAARSDLMMNIFGTVKVLFDLTAVGLHARGQNDDGAGASCVGDGDGDLEAAAAAAVDNDARLHRGDSGFSNAKAVSDSSSTPPCNICLDRARFSSFGDSPASPAALALRRQMFYAQIRDMQTDVIPRLASMLNPPPVESDDEVNHVESIFTAILVVLISKSRSVDLYRALIDFLPRFVNCSSLISILFSTMGGNFATVSMLIRSASHQNISLQRSATRFVFELLGAATSAYYCPCCCDKSSQSKFVNGVADDHDDKYCLTDDELLSSFSSSNLSLHYVHLLSALCLSGRAELVLIGCRAMARLVEIDQINAVAIEIAGGFAAILSIVSRELKIESRVWCAFDTSWILSLGASTLLDPLLHFPRDQDRDTTCEYGFTASASKHSDAAPWNHLLSHEQPVCHSFGADESARVLGAALQALRQLDAALSREGRNDAAVAVCIIVQTAVESLSITNMHDTSPGNCIKHFNYCSNSLVCDSLNKVAFVCKTRPSDESAPKCDICLSAWATAECIDECCVQRKATLVCPACDSLLHGASSGSGKGHHVRVKLAPHCENDEDDIGEVSHETLFIARRSVSNFSTATSATSASRPDCKAVEPALQRIIATMNEYKNKLLCDVGGQDRISRECEDSNHISIGIALTFICALLDDRKAQMGTIPPFFVRTLVAALRSAIRARSVRAPTAGFNSTALISDVWRAVTESNIDAIVSKLSDGVSTIHNLSCGQGLDPPENDHLSSTRVFVSLILQCLIRITSGMLPLSACNSLCPESREAHQRSELLLRIDGCPVLAYLAVSRDVPLVSADRHLCIWLLRDLVSIFTVAKDCDSATEVARWLQWCLMCVAPDSEEAIFDLETEHGVVSRGTSPPSAPVRGHNEFVWFVLVQELRVLLAGSLEAGTDYCRYFITVELGNESSSSMQEVSYAKLIRNLDGPKCLLYTPRRRRAVQQVMMRSGILTFLAEHVFGKFAPIGVLTSIFSEGSTAPITAQAVLSWWRALACFAQLIVGNDEAKDVLTHCSVSVDGILATLTSIMSNVVDHRLAESLLLLVFEILTRRGHILPGGIIPYPVSRVAHFGNFGAPRGMLLHNFQDGSFADLSKALSSKVKHVDSVFHICSLYVVHDSSCSQLMRAIWHQSNNGLADESHISESASVDSKSIATASSGPIFGSALASQFMLPYEAYHATGFAPSRSTSIEKFPSSSGAVSRSVETFLRLHGGQQRPARSDSFASHQGSVSNWSVHEDEPPAGDGSKQSTKILLSVIGAAAGSMARNASHASLGEGLENHSLSAENMRESELYSFEPISPKINSEQLNAHDRATRIYAAEDYVLLEILHNNLIRKFPCDGDLVTINMRDSNSSQVPSSPDLSTKVLQSNYRTLGLIRKELAAFVKQLKVRYSVFQKAIGLNEFLKTAKFGEIVFSSPCAALRLIAICSVVSGYVQRSGLTIISRMVQENIANSELLSSDDAVAPVVRYVLEQGQNLQSSAHGVLVGLLRHVFGFKMDTNALNYLLRVIEKASPAALSQDRARESMSDEVSRTAFFILGQTAEARQVESFVHFTGQSPFRHSIPLQFAKEFDALGQNSSFHLKSWLRLAPLCSTSNTFAIEVNLGGINSLGRRTAIHLFWKPFAVAPCIYNVSGFSDVETDSPNVCQIPNDANERPHIRLCISVLELVDSASDQGGGPDRSSSFAGREEDDWSTDYGTYTVTPLATFDRGSDNSITNSKLATMVAKHAMPDVVVDFDWSDDNTWRLLSLDFICGEISNCDDVPFRCCIDECIAPLLMWTPLGYIDCATVKSQPNSLAQHLWSGLVKTKICGASIGGSSVLQQEYDSISSKIDSNGSLEAHDGVLLEALDQLIHGYVGEVAATTLEVGHFEVAEVAALVKAGPRRLCTEGTRSSASSFMHLVVSPQTRPNGGGISQPPPTPHTQLTTATSDSDIDQANKRNMSLNNASVAKIEYLKLLCNTVLNNATFSNRSADILLFERQSIASVVGKLGGLRALFGRLCCHRRNQVASTRILASLLNQSADDYSSFAGADGFSLALFCLCRHPQSAKPCHTAVEVLQILFDLAVAPQTAPDLMAAQSVKAAETLQRVEVLRLLVDIACTNVTKPKIARCVVDWLRTLCEDHPENLRFVIDHVGVATFLVLLSAWSVVECDVLYKSTALGSPTPNQSSRRGMVAVQNAADSSHNMPWATNRSEAAKEIGRLQLSTARFLRQLMTGTFCDGQSPSSNSSGLNNISSILTGFSSSHLEQIFNFIILVASRFAGIEKLETSEGLSMHRGGLPHVERTAQLAIELLTGVLGGPLGRTFASMIRSIWGNNFSSVVLDLMASAHISVKLGAVNLLCLLLSDSGGDVDAKQLAAFEKSGGFHCMASVLPIGMSNRANAEAGLPLVGSSSDDDSIASADSSSNKERNITTSVDYGGASSGYIRDLIHSLLAVLMWRNKRKVVDRALPGTSHKDQDFTTLSPDGVTSVNASATSTSGFLSMFGWLGQSNASSAAPSGADGGIAKQGEPLPDNSATLVNIEVIVIPQVLEALFAVLQHVDDADLLKQTLDVIGDALQPRLPGSTVGFEAIIEVALKNIDILCAQRDWITWLCNCYVSFHRRFSVGHLRGDPGSVSESELAGGDLSGFESEDSVETSGVSPQRARRRSSASRQQHRGSMRSTDGEGRPTSVSPVPRLPSESIILGAPDADDGNSSVGDRSLGFARPLSSMRTHLLERYVEPLYTFALRIFKMDLLSRPSQNRRYLEVVNKLPMDFPEARQFQMNLLFDILETIPSLACETFESSINLVKNLASLLEQVAEKIDASIELSVAAVECVNALLYNCPAPVRQRVKDTSLSEMRVLFVTRCLIERNVELEVKAVAFRDIRSSIVSLVSSNDAKSLQDSQVLLMIFDVFIEAMEEIEYSLEVAADASTANLSPREEAGALHPHHPVARAQSPLSIDDAMSATSHNFVSIDALNDRIDVMKNIQVICLEIIQDILNASTECRKYVAKLFDGIESNLMARWAVGSHGQQGSIVSAPNGLLRSDVWRAALTNRYTIDRVTEDDLRTLESAHSNFQMMHGSQLGPDGPNATDAMRTPDPSTSAGFASGAPLSAQMSASNSSWWAYWTSTSSAAVAVPIVTSAAPPASVAASSPPLSSISQGHAPNIVPPLQLPKARGMLDSNAYLFPVGVGTKTVDNRVFLDWFANTINSDFRSEVRDLLVRDLKALLRQSEKVHERVMQRRARSVRLCLERISQARAATAKLARERLDSSRQYCTRRANASSKDCKSTVDGIFRRIVAGEDAFAPIKSNAGVEVESIPDETPPSLLLVTLSTIELRNRQAASTV